MASSEFPSPEEVQKQIKAISEAAATYDPGKAAHDFVGRTKIISQARELIDSLTDPDDLPLVHIGQAMELVALRSLMHMGVFAQIPSQGSISLSSLSQATKAEESLLERLLRILVCVGFVRQLENGEYAHTRLSRTYAAMPGPGMYFQFIYDEAGFVLSNFHRYLQEKGYKEPDDQRYSPYTWRAGQEGKTVWEVMAQQPERLQAFQAGIAASSTGIPLTRFYDFSKLKTEDDRPVLVDIGGGNGQSILRIMEAHPDIPANRFILQELKEPAEVAKGVLPQGVVIMEHDFFGPQPVKGAKAYMLRRVLHDYSDAVCIDILKQIVPAMASDSVVLIADFVFPDASSPADLPIAAIDLVVMNMGGKERSEQGFKKILQAAGLEFIATYRSEAGFGAFIVARRANTT
ncbi:O-methyltransferase gsfC [Exophiala dermatitidis]